MIKWILLKKRGGYEKNLFSNQLSAACSHNLCDIPPPQPAIRPGRMLQATTIPKQPVAKEWNEFRSM
jgi:hypothetical protein